MKQKKTGKQSMVGTIVTMLIVALIILVLYYYVVNGDRSDKSGQVQTGEVQKLLDKEINENYPATPREVVKLYLKIMSCFYGEEITEDQLQGLGHQIRLLMDDELLENNPWDAYLADLKTEIAKYRDDELVVDSYEVEKGSAVEYYSKQGKECASLKAEITTRDKQLRYHVGEKFILRKDNDGNYKILGWKITEDTNLDEH